MKHAVERRLRNCSALMFALCMLLVFASASFALTGSTPVTVTNTTSNPVPVTPSAVTSVLYSYSGQDSWIFQTVDVSHCQSVRVTVHPMWVNQPISVLISDPLADTTIDQQLNSQSSYTNIFTVPGVSMSVEIWNTQSNLVYLQVYCRP